MTVSTVASIAAHLGISRTTVSNAFSRPDQLSPQLRAEILCVASALGYPGPDPLAQSLRRGSNANVGMLFGEELATSLLTPAAQRLLASVAAASEQYRGGLLLASATAHRGWCAAEPAGRASQPMAGGFITYGVSESALHVVIRRQIKLVVVGGPRPSNLHSAWVEFDIASGGYALGRYLVELGHRVVHLVRTPVLTNSFGWPEIEDTVEEQSFAGVARGLGSALTHVVELDGAPGEKQSAALLAQARSATALVCTSDATALALLHAAAGLGLEVPHQLSIVGCGDVPAAPAAGLTTIGEPSWLAGVCAWDLLGTSERHTLGAELIIRESVGHPRD